MIEAEKFRSVMRQLPTGVTLVTSLLDGEPVGMTANAIVSASLDPPLVVFCVSPSTNTYQGISRSRVFAVNMLAAEQEQLARIFAQGRTEDKFRETYWSTAVTGSPIIEGCVGWLDCTVGATHEAGDHVIVVAGVVQAETGRGDPLVFHRSSYGSYTSLISRPE